MSFAATKGSRIFVSLKAVINELPLHEICSWDCTNSGERASPFKSRKDLPILKTPQMLFAVPHDQLSFGFSLIAFGLHLVFKKPVASCAAPCLECSWDYNLLYYDRA
jgi:hypothetical protein